MTWSRRHGWSTLLESFKQITECSSPECNWSHAEFTVLWSSLNFPRFLHSVRHQVSCAIPYFSWLVAIFLACVFGTKKKNHCNILCKYFVFVTPDDPPLPSCRQEYQKPEVIYCRALLFTQTLWHHVTQASVYLHSKYLEMKVTNKNPSLPDFLHSASSVQ